jgi:Ni/Co efflux regulator RcnB
VKHLISATIALALLASSAAVAQPNSQGQNREQRQNDRDRSDRQGGNDRNNNDRNNDRNNEGWSRGGHVPSQYRQDQYIVRDWQQHNLRTPPRGYHWVRNDSDQYVLAAITSGIIAEIVSQNQYRSDYRWSRGDRLSGGYLESRFVVSDWRGNHLHRPTRGYHWVHVNNRYLMAKIGTGVMAEIVIND